MDNNRHWDFIAHILRPAKTIPRMPWTAEGKWDLSTGRILVLGFGLSIFGLGDSLLIQSHIGNAPWSVLAQGVSRHSPLSIGEATFLISGIVLLLWFPLRERPGFGTIANLIIIAAAIQLGLYLFPAIDHNFLVQICYVLLGILLVGFGTAFYITCGLGPGPRDGLMTAVHKRTGIRIGRVRLGIEVCALVIGALLGGRVGIGTALFALLIGNSIAISLNLVHKLSPV
jgi:uncharacterized membrane protein YczE